MRHWHDPEYKRIIHSREWAALRRRYITAHPLCEDCLQRGIYDAVAVEVHHVKPVGTGRTWAEKCALAFDEHNLRALCHDCHVRAHKTERHALAAAQRSGEVKDYLKENFGI